MVAGEEDVGDFEAAEVVWLGIGGSFEEIGIGKGFFFRGAGITEGSGEEADDGISDDGGGDGAIGQNVVADREFKIDEFVNDAVVDALVMAGEEDEVLGGGEFAGDLLLKDFSLRSEEDDLRILRTEFLDGGEDGLGLEEHSLAAAAEGVVGFPMPIGGPVAEIMRVDFYDLGFLRALHHALAERRDGDLGEEG